MMRGADPRVRLAAKLSPPTERGCTEFLGGRDRAGYGKFWWNGATHIAHRAAWLLSCGPIPDGLFVCHRCDNPPCCNIEHLFLGTTTENQADSITKGRRVRGERIHTAKLTTAAVRAIRAAAAAGEEHQSLAKRYGLNLDHVGRIVRRESWSHIGAADAG